MAAYDGKVVIVTGGAKGIGAGISRAFASEGASVAAVDIDTAAGESIAAEGKSLAGEIRFFNADVSQGAVCEKLVADVISAWGSGVDVLCNNVGIQPTNSYLLAHETPDDLWDRILDVNLKSHFLMTKHCVPHMIEKGKGVIINTASVQGLQSANLIAAYAASKGGILSLTRQLALDYAQYGIRVVAVNPGGIETPLVDEAVAASGMDRDKFMVAYDKIHPIGRRGQPADIANAMLFLASDQASFITGEYLSVDGGLMAKGAWADMGD